MAPKKYFCVWQFNQNVLSHTVHSHIVELELNTYISEKNKILYTLVKIHYSY